MGKLYLMHNKLEGGGSYDSPQLLSSHYCGRARTKPLEGENAG